MTLTKSDIDWLKEEFLTSLADAVRDKLKNQLDSISKKLDMFIGDVRDKRNAQELHTNQHDSLDQDITNLDIRVKHIEQKL